VATPRILIAGIGNIFLGDDAFGVEVARRLAQRTLPPGVTVRDFGIRGFDLACALQEGFDAVIFVDTMQQNSPPGTLHVVESTLPLSPSASGGDGGAPPFAGAAPEMHHLDPAQAIQMALRMGATLPRLRVVGCESAAFEPVESGEITLSDPVRDAIPRAVELIESLSVLERMASVGISSHKNPETELRDLIVDPEPFPGETSMEYWSGQTYRELIESLPDAVVVINQRGSIVLINEQTEQMFGYKRGEVLGRPIEILIPERFHRGHIGHRNRYFEAPRSRPMGAKLLELFGRRKDGSEFPVEVGLSPLKTERGTFATSVIRDISQRKRDEAKFRTLVENIPAVTFIAPLDESVPELYVSPQIEQLLGFSQKEWLEDPVLWYRQLHPDDQARWNHQFAPTCATGEAFNSVYRFIAKDGHVVWVHGSASVVRDADGMPSFLQGVAFDITSIREAEQAMRKAQEELRQANAELERRVEERTEALLAKAVELEKFADRSSHDLKSPLGNIKSRLEKLASRYADQFDEDAKKSINAVLGTTTGLSKLIVKLLEYAKAVKTNREPVIVDCTAVVGTVEERLLSDIEQYGVRINIARLPFVLGIYEELTSLFQNLMDNAIKYRDPDRPLQLEIGARPKGDRWQFWIRDNGGGIEPEKLPKLFAELGMDARVHPNWNKIAGHGYGLHICKTIVASHGGTIEVESKFGEGTTFYFTLPPAPARRAVGNV
jgi:hydrogenase maturation protease